MGHAGQVTGRGAWSEIEAELDGIRRRLGAEISGYPTPIAGCDAQFNHLLDQRRLVLDALARVARARAAEHQPSAFDWPEDLDRPAAKDEANR